MALTDEQRRVYRLMGCHYGGLTKSGKHKPLELHKEALSRLREEGEIRYPKRGQPDDG